MCLTLPADFINTKQSENKMYFDCGCFYVNILKSSLGFDNLSCKRLFQADAKLEEMLLECSVVTEYVDAMLLDERDSLEDPAIYEFMQHYYPKVSKIQFN